MASSGIVLTVLSPPPDPVPLYRANSPVDVNGNEPYRSICIMHVLGGVCSALHSDTATCCVQTYIAAPVLRLLEIFLPGLLFEVSLGNPIYYTNT